MTGQPRVTALKSKYSYNTGIGYFTSRYMPIEGQAFFIITEKWHIKKLIRNRSSAEQFDYIFRGNCFRTYAIAKKFLISYKKLLKKRTMEERLFQIEIQ